MHARVQSWFPFTIDFCLNGREWLARQLDQAGIGYRRRENCFVAIDNWPKAQQLAERQLQTDWPKKLTAILARVHPLHREICAPLDQHPALGKRGSGGVFWSRGREGSGSPGCRTTVAFDPSAACRQERNCAPHDPVASQSTRHCARLPAERATRTSRDH